MQVVSSIKWNTNGSVLAVSGLFNVVDMFKVAGTGEPGGVLELLVQFYSAHGQLLRTLKVRGGTAAAAPPPPPSCSYTLSLSCTL